jgi:transcriptional repressor NrdR
MVRRRRECVSKSCRNRFTTYERAIDPPLVVIKKNNRREMFDSRKIRMGMLKACEKRPIELRQIDEAIERIENGLRAEQVTEVRVKELGNRVMEELRGLDDVAYIRFASVYQEFDNAKRFAEILAALSE